MENQTPGVQRILAANIRSARKKLGYSQQALAERAEISPGHMNDLEQGRKWVSADTLERLADALKLKAFMLLLPPDPEQESHRHTYNALTRLAGALRGKLNEAVDTCLDQALRGEQRSPDER